MSYDEYGGHKFLQESRRPAPKQQFAIYEQKLLRELDEEELEHIRDAIDGADPHTLAFNKTFNGKTRLVLDFPTIDSGSDLGEFLTTFRNLEYDMDWSKGILSGEKTLKDSSVGAAVRTVLGEPQPEPKQRKINMKVGKFLATTFRLAKKFNELFQKIVEQDTVVRRSGVPHRPDLHPGQVTGNLVDQELVIGHILVDRCNHPVPVAVPERVLPGLKSMCLGFPVAGHIQPVATPSFPVLG